MTQQGGDRKYPDGDAVTVTNDDGSQINAGELLLVTGYDSANERPQVQKANSGDEDEYHCVAADDAADGAKLTARFGGTPWVRVDDSADVTAGQEVAPSGTDGIATDATAGGTGKGDVFMTPETDIGGTKYAVVHLG